MFKRERPEANDKWCILGRLVIRLRLGLYAFYFVKAWVVFTHNNQIALIFRLIFEGKHTRDSIQKPRRGHSVQSLLQQGGL